MYLKAALFVVIGAAACTIVLLERPALRVALCLAIAIWAFARAYYFAFYVIEHYIDDRYKYSGLISFVRYLIGRSGRRQSIRAGQTDEPQDKPESRESSDG
jgi:hypothetical protein